MRGAHRKPSMLQISRGNAATIASPARFRHRQCVPAMLVPAPGRVRERQQPQISGNTAPFRWGSGVAICRQFSTQGGLPSLRAGRCNSTSNQFKHRRCGRYAVRPTPPVSDPACVRALLAQQPRRLRAQFATTGENEMGHGCQGALRSSPGPRKRLAANTSQALPADKRNIGPGCHRSATSISLANRCVCVVKWRHGFACCAFPVPLGNGVWD
jgi:hypothetical protein